ncbi:MAG: glucose-6-phosphate dehydrogenase [Cyclobacteriaceae bacterium]|nr:glucose-6-phosphate dehydrogenase [Cyclobacteriaceae bacterium]
MKAENSILVIFGASGDLTLRKLIPALSHLYQSKLLADKFLILGAGRSDFDDEEFRRKMFDENEFISNGPEDQIPENFRKILYYFRMETSDPKEYKKLKLKLEKLSGTNEIPENYIFYLSTPPNLFETIARGLSQNGLNIQQRGYKRLIIEKPFGFDLESSRKLNKSLHACFEESQIYRIDHYLGKETVQNLLVTRFSNSIFEPLWNRNFIHHVEITAAEDLGVENRAGYYEQSGALRDMIQNHLLNLVGMIAIEPPTDLKAESIRNETIKLFKSFRPFSKKDIKNNIIRGQYLSSQILGKRVNGYREEPNVDKNSRTETYVALKLFIDNWRWADVPFYIRTGKRLPARVTEIVIHFKSTPHYLFTKVNNKIDKDNQLIFRIQPDEGILLKFGIKTPGSGFEVSSVNMDFLYSGHTGSYIPEAYERLLLDGIHGDATLYPRNDAVVKAWELVDPVLKEWETNRSLKVHGYPAGTWGPENADSLLEGKLLTWSYPCKNLTGDGRYCEL